MSANWLVRWLVSWRISQLAKVPTTQNPIYMYHTEKIKIKNLEPEQVKYLIALINTYEQETIHQLVGVPFVELSVLNEVRTKLQKGKKNLSLTYHEAHYMNKFCIRWEPDAPYHQMTLSQLQMTIQPELITR